jgi:drug/metabolite transporter (DMT)-like permease
MILPLIGSRLPRTRRLWAWAFAIGFGNTTLTQVGISVGTQRAGAAVAAVLLNSSPFFVALIARLALGEAITRLRAAGLVIGFSGVLLVVFSDPGNIAHGSRLAVGFVLALLGALGWAGGGLGMRVLTQREPDLDIPGITAAQFLTGAIPLVPLALLAGGTTDWGRATLDLQLAYLVLGGQVLVYLGFNAALSRWPSTRVYAWTFLVPAVAVVIEAAQGQLPGPAATIGVAIVILGVAIVNHPRAEQRATEPAVLSTAAEPALLGDREPTI